MANVYSKVHYKAANVSTVGFVAATVPAGFVWTIRTVTLVNMPTAPSTTTWATILNGITLRNGATNIAICGALAPYAVTNRFYKFDLHHVMNAGDQLDVFAAESGWSVYVSGYQLTLP